MAFPDVEQAPLTPLLVEQLFHMAWKIGEAKFHPEHHKHLWDAIIIVDEICDMLKCGIDRVYANDMADPNVLLVLNELKYFSITDGLRPRLYRQLTDDQCFYETCVKMFKWCRESLELLTRLPYGMSMPGKQ